MNEDRGITRLDTHIRAKAINEKLRGWAAVHGVAKSQTQLSDFTFTFEDLFCTVLLCIPATSS